MTRLMIVEDEKVVRMTMSTIIDWEEHGIEFIGACKDGLEAYDLIVDEYPDIVITDIRMPAMSGLDLIERTSKMDRSAKFIILSGYNDFEYAKTAMQYGVKHYLLKPCDETEILTAVKELEADIQQERQSELQHKKEYAQRFSSLLKRQLTVEAITQTGNYDLLLEQYGLLLEQPDQELFLYTFGNLSEEALPQFIEYITKLKGPYDFQFLLNILYAKDTAYCVLSFTDTDDSTAFDSVISNVQGEHSSLSQLSWNKNPYHSITQLLTALSKEIHRYNRVILVDNEHAYQEIYNYVSTFQTADATVDILREDLTQERIVQTIDTLFSGITDLELSRMLAMRLVGTVVAEQQKSPLFDSAHFFQEIYHLTTPEEVATYSKRALLRIVPSDTPAAEKEYKDFIVTTLDYIENHLDDPRLSLKWLAENVLYMNVDYFGKQFVEQTGERFSNYLNTKRMERAKEILAEDDIEHVYEVAERVGCGNNPQYFSQLFKKHTGYTPTEFRSLCVDL